jgi:hypothetical protein
MIAYILIGPILVAVLFAFSLYFYWSRLALLAGMLGAQEGKTGASAERAPTARGDAAGREPAARNEPRRATESQAKAMPAPKATQEAGGGAWKGMQIDEGASLVEVIAALPEAPAGTHHGLEGATLREALDALADYAKLVAPDCLLGLNPAGRLLSVYVAKRNGLPFDRCAFVGSDPLQGGFWVQDHDGLRGSVLLLDDLTRSGGTLTELPRYLKQVAPNAALSFAIMVVNSKSAHALSDDALPLRWAMYHTRDSRYAMPWTGFSLRVKEAFPQVRSDKEQGRPIDLAAKRTLKQLRHLLSDSAFALEAIEGFVADEPINLLEDVSA